jgi:RimJ/RimL family protein N-acetyltransferase
LIVRHRSEYVAIWAGAKLGGVFRQPFVAWGIADKDGNITGAVIFNDYDACNVEVTCVGHGWTRGVIREIGRYCYEDLACTRVSITTRMSNSLVHSLAARLGGRLEGIKRRYYGDEDAVLYGVLKDEFRF